MKILSKKYYVLLSMIIMLMGGVGCSSDSTNKSDTTEPHIDNSVGLNTDLDLQSAINEENRYAVELVDGVESVDNAIEEILSIAYSSGLTKDEIELLDPALLDNYFQEYQLERIASVAEMTMIPNTTKIIEAVDNLKYQESFITSYSNQNSKERILPYVIAAIGGLTFLDIGTQCYAEWQQMYYNCYNSKMAGDCPIYNDKHEIISVIPCKDIVLSNTGIGPSCAMESTMKIGPCMDKAAVNILTSLTKDAVSFFSAPTAGAIAIKSTKDSVENTYKNTSTIISVWKDGECSPENRSTHRASDKTYLYLAQSNSESVQLPSGLWDVTAFKEGYIRKTYENICIKPNEVKEIALEPSTVISLTSSSSSSSGSTTSIPGINEGIAVSINIGGYSSAFTPVYQAFLIEEGMPGILGVTFDGNDEGETVEKIIIKFLPGVTENSTLTITSPFTDPNAKVAIGYNANNFDHAFYCVSGTVQVSSFSIEFNKRLSGEFDCTLAEINDDGTILNANAGNMSGTFNGILHPYSYYQ